MPGHADRLSYRSEHEGAMYSRIHHVEDLSLDDFDGYSFPLGASSQGKKRWIWAKIMFWVALAFCFFGVLGVWVLPTFLDKVIVPAMEWEVRNFSRPVLALVLILSMALLPLLLIPTMPCMWLSGMVFSYGFGFLIIMAGMLMGTSFPFFVSRCVLQAKIQKWIQKWPKWAGLIRLAGQGSWLRQFQVLFILRLSPIPYTVFNYIIATTDVKYGPYFCSSAAILIPEAFISIYSGRLLKSLADIKTSSQKMGPFEIVYNVVGFSMMFAVAIGGTIYGRKALRELEIVEEAGDCESAELKDSQVGRYNEPSKGLNVSSVK